MAIINKINDKAGLVIGFIVIGLGAFIAGDLLSSRSIFTTRDTGVGSIEGKEISYEEYNNTLEYKKYEYQAQGPFIGTLRFSEDLYMKHESDIQKTPYPYRHLLRRKLLYTHHQLLQLCP